MCGRFVRTAGWSAIAELAQVRAPLPAGELARSWNVAPTNLVPVVRLGADGRREAVLMHWGLPVEWANRPLVNAKAETIHQLRTFRAAFCGTKDVPPQRCLMFADGYYEWDRSVEPNIPHYFSHREGALIAFAGIWTVSEIKGVPQETCCIITTTPNELVSPIHDRMPVILEPDEFELWLGGDWREAHKLLDSRSWPMMIEVVVGRDVNNWRNNGPQLILPA